LATETVIRSLRERERQRDQARKLRYIRGKIRSGATTIVTIEENGQTKDLTNKREIENAILLSNKEKLSQSSHTPFYQHPLKEEFGFKGLTQAAQAALAGVYSSRHDMTQYVYDVIKQWRKPPQLCSLPTQAMPIHISQYRSFRKKAKENTACYPHCMLFLTMKAGALDDYISEIECRLTKISLAAGFAPGCWKKCKDVMITKKSGDTALSELRTIVLFPVDLSFWIHQKLKFKRSFPGTIFFISILSSKCYMISTCFALPDPKANAQ
jgi:hypothetical protein